jgi:MFS transporter, putative metabolite:H+ symporter
MLDVLEQQQRLTKNQWKIISAAVLGDMLDFFDYGLIAFALAFIVGQWKLTYGQSAMILLSAGIGAVPGALIWGWLADRIGRRKVFIGTALNFSIFTGLMALTPDAGGWIFLAVMRLFVGAGVSGLFAVDLPLVQEFVPTRKRGWVGGVVTCCLPLGSVLAAILGAYVEPYVGWRGLFAIGLLPAFLTLLIRAWVPESPRWLMRMGRPEEARKSLAWALEVDPAEIELPAEVGEVKRTPYRELFKHPRSMAVTVLSSLGTQAAGNGIGLWAPTLLVLLLKIPPGRASFLMIWVALIGFLGRFAWAYLSDAIGRRPSGILLSFGGAVSLVIAGLFHDVFLGGVSVFLLMLMAQRFFGDGGYALVGPYSAEVWPAALRGSGMGFGYGLGNFGKIVGPLGLALIVGSTDIVKPQASLPALEPAMYYLAAWSVISGLAFILWGIEVKGRSIEEIDAALTKPARAPAQAERAMGD